MRFALAAVWMLFSLTSHANAAGRYEYDLKDRTLAKGRVFEDVNGNRKRDRGEIWLSGIKVSNGREIALTDAKGRYALPYDEQTTFFVIKPSGYATPQMEHNLPHFYYHHFPNGSPELKHEGISPTGKLPKSIDFPLRLQNEPDTFKAILFADPQPRNQVEIDYVTHDVVEELIGTDATFGVTLGDIMSDQLNLFGSQNAAIGLIGIPWYNVVGNHDVNRDAREEFDSNSSFRNVYGPPYYSFDYGKVHFLVIDNIEWIPAVPEKKGHYKPGLEPDQWAFIENDLALIPNDQLLVILMHVPLQYMSKRERLFRLIEKRPFTFSVSGHTHVQEHTFLTEEDGWLGEEPHHHMVNVTVSGSWWSGMKNEIGIPHTRMRDGAPNGYSIVTFDKNSYDVTYKAARHPADYQMNIYAPEVVHQGVADTVEVFVNVFGGSAGSLVEMRLANSSWIPMTFAPERVDPLYVEVSLRENLVASLKRKNRRASPTRHGWIATLPASPPAGTHLIQIRTTDMFGKTYADQRIIRIAN
jgi:hypothetical protein